MGRIRDMISLPRGQRTGMVVLLAMVALLLMATYLAGGGKHDENAEQADEDAIEYMEKVDSLLQVAAHNEQQAKAAPEKGKRKSKVKTKLTAGSNKGGKDKAALDELPREE